MREELERTALVLGESAIATLEQKKVAIFGLGGVGGYVAEALARSGIGSLDLIDHDTVSLSNINRQILALHSTVGQLKVDVARNRILDINPACQVRTFPIFFLPDNQDTFLFSQYDYVVDAIDTVTGKIAIIEKAKQAGVSVISCMGTGNKTDPSQFRVSDISRTSVCPLARVMRKELKDRQISDVKVIWSPEEPHCFQKNDVPGSTAFCPSAAGLVLASEVILDLTGETK